MYNEEQENYYQRNIKEWIINMEDLSNLYLANKYSQKKKDVGYHVGKWFVFGIFVPRIYLPDTLENNEKEYVLLHERTHIKHGDWLIKIIGVFAVAVHWFNPLVWLAYMLFERDIEMSCDESVVAGMDTGLKLAYTMSIVSFAKQSNTKRYLGQHPLNLD